MIKKILWAIAVIVFALYLLFFHFYVSPFNFSDFIESIGFISTFFTPLIVGSGLALMIALVPVKHTSFGRRFGLSLPVTICLISALFVWAFYLQGQRYAAIAPAPGGDCRSVHDGVFLVDDLLIERNGHLQIQTDKKTNTKERFEVTWLSDCEYVLSSAGREVKVKIVTASRDGYECYVLQNGRTSKKFTLHRQN